MHRPRDRSHFERFVVYHQSFYRNVEAMVTTRPGLLGSQPTRLVTWMYSAEVLGWPRTTVGPSRVMLRPTEIMLVAMATSTRPSSWNVRLKRCLAAASRRSGTVNSTDRVFVLPTSRGARRFGTWPLRRIRFTSAVGQAPIHLNR